MPESSVRKAAADKKKLKRHEAEVGVRSEKARSVNPGSGRWVAPAFVTVGLLGVAWLVVYYVGHQYIPFMMKLGNWNMLIGMGLIACSFILAAFWK